MALVSAIILKILRKLEPLHIENNYLFIYFDPTVVETKSDCVWQSRFCKIKNGNIINEMKFINTLTTAKSSTASVERIFFNIY